jgi:hypothetical protein
VGEDVKLEPRLRRSLLLAAGRDFVVEADKAEPRERHVSSEQLNSFHKHQRFYIEEGIEMAQEAAARAFFTVPYFAVVGASSDPTKFGHKSTSPPFSLLPLFQSISSSSRG